MSFFNKIRRALGFDDDSIFENEPNTSVLTDDSDDLQKTPARDEAPSPAPAAEAANPALHADAIFTHVVAQFNLALPDFLSKSVDPEQQRKLLYENLEQGIKEYLESLASEADARCEARWNDEQTKLRGEMEALRQKAEQIEHQRADIKERQLSADRQKRALSERLRDLENQVGRLEAEREQYDLENKSLLNKLKVLAVQNPDIDINAAGALPTVDSEELEALKAENAALKEELKQAADRQAIANELYNDEQRRLKAALRDVEDLKAITEQVEIVQKAIADRDARIERQNAHIKQLKEEIETLRSDASATADDYRQQIARLEEQLAARTAAAADGHEVEYEAAPSASDVEAVVAPQQSRKKSSRKRKQRESQREVETPRISDDDLEMVEAGFTGSEWFGTADETPARDKNERTDKFDDFGYHAPEPKPRPYDDGMQMSLFD